MFWRWVSSAEKVFWVGLLPPIHGVAEGILVGANTGVVMSAAIVGLLSTVAMGVVGRDFVG
jgi:hypothetical protein